MAARRKTTKSFTTSTRREKFYYQDNDIGDILAPLEKIVTHLEKTDQITALQGDKLNREIANLFYVFQETLHPRVKHR